MLGSTGVSTPSQWLRVAKTLTDALVRNDMTTRDDCIVQVVDHPGAESRPIAWHVPATSDIVLNATLIKGMERLTRLDDAKLESLCEKFLAPERIVSYTSGHGYRSMDERLDMLAMLRIRGVIAHEAAHSIFSHWLLAPWAAKMQSGRDKLLFDIIMQLEEVRIESQQIDRSDDFRKSMRFSAKMIAPTREDIEKLRSSSGGLSVPRLALNSVLTLGRADRGILESHEVKAYRELVEDVVGTKRFSVMRDIWSDFADIPLGHEQFDMKALAEEWRDLFDWSSEDRRLLAGLVVPVSSESSESDESADGDGFDEPDDETDSRKPAHGKSADGDKAPSEHPDSPTTSTEKESEDEDENGETIKLDELAKKLAEALEKAGEEAEKNADEEKGHHPNASVMEDAKAAAQRVWRRKPSHVKERKPRPEERVAAAAMAKRLEQMSVRTRSVTVHRSLTPPGRLQSRAAVLQSAHRSMGRATTATPWERKTRKATTTNPKLTVGVMTDVSGSMGWATDLVASLSWIVSKGVSHINGTVAATVFGDRAQPILAPRTVPRNVIVREACDGSEAFNEACAALDGVLRLSDSTNGVRILFVVSDGFLVNDGEMPAAAAWVEKLTKVGCVVVWVTDTDPKTKYGGYACAPEDGGYTCVPEGALPVQIADCGWDRKIEVKPIVDQMIDRVLKAFS